MDEIGFPDAVRRLRWSGYVRVLGLVEGHETAFRAATAVALAALTGILAQISILTPLTPVPYTLQVFGIALMGGLLGSRWGALSALLYLLLGILGLPVFALQVSKAGGWALAYTHVHWWSGLDLFLLGEQLAASAGYLLGYPMAAWLTGRFAEGRAHRAARWPFAAAAAFAAGLVAIAFLDIFALAESGTRFYPQTFTQRAYFAVLLAGVLALVLAAAWLALSTRHRRERVELFVGMFLGLGLLYATGALWFWMAAHYKGSAWLSGTYGVTELGLLSLLRLTVLPFFAVDTLKILGAIGLVALVRPTLRERAAQAPGRARAGG